jgi:O-antigen/teichoic acid export membrane protein
MGKFTKDAIITFATRFSSVILGLVISVIIARALGPEGRGVYSLAILLPGLLVTFTNLGINPATVFYVARKKYPPKEVLGNNIILTILISILTISIGLIIIRRFHNELFPGVGNEYLLLALGLIPFPLLFDFVSHILVGMQKIKAYNVFHLLQSFLFLISIGVLLLGFQFGIKAAISAQIISFFLAGTALFVFVRKETQGVFLRPNRQYLKDVPFYGVRAHLGGVISFLHYRTDLFLINIFLNPFAVGLYSVAVALAEGMWLISRSVGTVLFPKLASERDSESLKLFTPLVCRHVLIIAFSVAVLLFFFGHWLIVLLYSETFLGSIQPFRILLIGAVAVSGHSVLVYFLMATGRPMLVSYITGISLILNIILNVIWIPHWGIIGAAWATTVSYSAMFMISLFVYSKISGNAMKDTVIPQKSDFQNYANLVLSIKLVISGKTRFHQDSP